MENKWPKMQFKWPDNKRIAIMMSFDLDAETLWYQRSNIDDYKDHITNVSRGTYGPQTGVPRILNMLDTHDIKATFYVPGWCAEQHPETIKEMIRRGHEIGAHGYEHEEGGGRTLEEEEEIINKGKEALKRVVNVVPKGHRGPGGVVYEYSTEMFLKAGFIYSSNYRDSDGPFFHRVNGKDVPLVELPKDSLYDDGFYMCTFSDPLRQSMKSPLEAIDMMKDEFDGLAEEGGRMMTFVFHPQLSGHPGRCKALSEFIGYMKANGAWFARSCDVAQYLIDQHGPFEPVEWQYYKD